MFIQLEIYQVRDDIENYVFSLCYKNNEHRFLIQLLVFLEKPSKNLMFRFCLKTVMDS